MFVVVGEKLLNQLTLTAHIKALSICQINISSDLKKNNEAATFEHLHEAWTGKSEVKGLSEQCCKLNLMCSPVVHMNRFSRYFTDNTEDL